MTELFGMIKKLGKHPAHSRTSPFASVKSARLWLGSIPRTTDYDAHHALVEGLERFNADTRGDAVRRLQVLRTLEAAGLPCQEKIVEQYLRNQGVLKFARQSLWRESQMFWNHLSAAYLHLFKLTLKGDEKEKLAPWVAEITLKSLRYTAMCIRWEYLRGQAASGLIWRRMHKIYRAAEISGVASTEVEMGGEEKTSCAREYALSLVLELANPPGFKPQEICQLAEMLEGMQSISLPEMTLRKGRHTHYVDLSAPLPATLLDDRPVRGKRVRYLDLTKLIEAIAQRSATSSDPQQGLLFQQFVRVINRGGIRRDGARAARFGDAWVGEGLESVMSALSAQAQGMPGLSVWGLRDESREGLGFVLQGESSLPVGRLAVVSYQPGEDAWKLLAVRWVRHSDGKTLVGTQCLSRHPKLVTVETSDERTRFLPRGETGIFVPLADTSQGMISNLILPRSAYSSGAEITMRDGEVCYRLRLGEISEAHEEDWVRVSFDVLSREVATPLAA